MASRSLGRIRRLEAAHGIGARWGEEDPVTRAFVAVDRPGWPARGVSAAWWQASSRVWLWVIRGPEGMALRRLLHGPSDDA